MFSISSSLLDRSFDIPDRTFHSMATTWRLSSFESATDVKELIPEFFFLTEFLENTEGNISQKRSFVIFYGENNVVSLARATPYKMYKIENLVFTLIIHQVFPVQTNPPSVVILDLCLTKPWCRLRKAPFSKCPPSTLKSKAGIFQFLPSSKSSVVQTD